MSVYSLISSFLSYVFTTIIYLFIFSVIALIYMDIKRINRGETDDGYDMENEVDEVNESAQEDNEAETLKLMNRRIVAYLRTVKSREAKECGMKASYKIGEKGAIIGRGADCDISIKDMYLSVEHFQIWYEKGIWYIGDMGSKNGTFLNEVRLKKVKTLHTGDEISFGGLQAIFEEGE